MGRSTKELAAELGPATSVKSCIATTWSSLANRCRQRHLFRMHRAHWTRSRVPSRVTLPTDSTEVTFAQVAQSAREAAATLATVTRADKDAALLRIADALEQQTTRIVAANEKDTARAREQAPRCAH